MNFTKKLFTLLFILSSLLTYSQFPFSPFFETKRIGKGQGIPPVNKAPKFPGGRIAMLFDGQNLDADDHGAMPLNFLMLDYTDLEDNLVWVGYNSIYKTPCATTTSIPGLNSATYLTNGLGTFNDWCEIMDTAAYGGARRFNIDTNVIFDLRAEYAANSNINIARDSLAAQIDASGPGDTLWILGGGPMSAIYEALDVSNLAKHQYVYLLSHAGFNETSAYQSLPHTGIGIDSVFTSIGFLRTCDLVGNPCLENQNTTDGRDDFADEGTSGGIPETGNPSTWDWMYASNGAPAEVDWLRKINNDNFFRGDKSKIVDWSDSGMLYFLLSGGPNNGGCENCGTAEIEYLVDNGEMYDGKIP